MQRASRENIERETLEKNKIDLSTIFTQRLFKFLYSHPLHCYILKRFITKTFSHHTHICEKVIWCLGSNQEGTNSHWLMLWFIAESEKLKKTKVWHNLIGVGVSRAQVHQVDQASRVFCCSCIPTAFFSGLFTAWRVAVRFYAEGFGFLFDNTSLCCHCVCISLPLIFTI